MAILTGSKPVSYRLRITDAKNPREFIGYSTVTHTNNNSEPLGFEFRPRDKELVGHDLFNKVCSIEFSDDDKRWVADYDLYGEEEPSSIWQKFHRQDHHELIFIIKLKHIKKKNDEISSRIERKVGLNSRKWHGEDAPREFEVLVSSSETERCYVTAIRKIFNYRNPGSDQHCLWIMHEFSLKKNDEYVICRLRKNIHGAKVVDKVHGGKKRVANADISRNFSKKKMRKTVQCQKAPECHESELADQLLIIEPEKKQQQFTWDDDMLLLDDLMRYSFDVEELLGDACH